MLAALLVGALAVGGLTAAVWPRSERTWRAGPQWPAGKAVDNLNRFVVVPAVGTSEAATKPATSPAAALPPLAWQLFPGQSPEALGHVGADVLARYPSGEVWAFTSDGHRYLYSGPLPTEEPPTTSVTDQLRRTPGVDHVTELLDGRLHLATSLSRAQVAALPNVGEVEEAFEVSVSGAALPMPPDAPGWFLSNNGTSTTSARERAIAGADTGAGTAWVRGRGAGQVLAVIDTGLQDMPQLRGALWQNPREACGSTVDTDGDGLVGDCNGWNFMTNSPDVTNRTGDATHGTDVASVAAGRVGNGARSAGLAPDLQIMPLVVGSGGTVNVALGTRAIYYAVDHGANVINLSYGGAGWPQAELSAFAAAVAYAANRNVLVVAAAGNDSANRDFSPVYPASLRAPNMLTVGATTAADTRATFSAYGKNSVDLFAPGDLLQVRDSRGLGMVSGTSFSSPLVAAAAAMLGGLQPGVPVTELRRQLLATATVIPALAPYSVSSGRLNAGAALAAVASAAEFSFSGLDTLAVHGTGTVDVTVASTGAATSLRVGLATRISGQVYAVADIGVDAGAAGGGVTGNDGTVMLSPDLTELVSGVRVPLELAQLPAGEYALVAQLVDGGTPVGQPTAALFTVNGAPSTVPPVPSETPTSGGTPPSSNDPAPTPTSPWSPQPTVAPPPPWWGNPTPTASPTSSPVTPSSAPTPVPTSSWSAPTSPPPGSAGPTSSPLPPAPTSAPPPPGSTTPPSSPTPPGSVGPTPAPPGSPKPSVTPVPIPSSSPTPSSPSPTPPPVPSAPPTTVPEDSVHFGVTSITPWFGPAEGGTLVTIRGTNLPSRPSILFGARPARLFYNGAPTMVIVEVPSHTPGRVDVQIGAAGGAVEVLHNAYIYLAAEVPAPGGTPAPTTPPTTPAAPPPAPGPTPTPTPTASIPAGPAPSPTGNPTVNPTMGPTGGPSPTSGAGTPPPGGSGPSAQPSFPPSTLRLALLPTTGLLSGLRPGAWDLAPCANTCPGLRL